jgi:hypothetical protein
MTRPHALSLSDQQLKLVQTGARFMPPETRDYFLRRVADALSNTKTPTDAQVFVAVRDVLTATRVPVYHFAGVGDGD